MPSEKGSPGALDLGMLAIRGNQIERRPGSVPSIVGAGRVPPVLVGVEQQGRLQDDIQRRPMGAGRFFPSGISLAAPYSNGERQPPNGEGYAANGGDRREPAQPGDRVGVQASAEEYDTGGE